MFWSVALQRALSPQLARTGAFVNTFVCLFALPVYNEASSSYRSASSRSHALALVQVARSDAGATRFSQIYLVDLAGSESLDVHDDAKSAYDHGRGDAAAKAARISECKSINVSLLALSRVIHSLSERETHVPVRDSKLTRLLANSLGGTSSACLVINVSPDKVHASAAVSSLRFGKRAMAIQVGSIYLFVLY
jgi:hypothetical protein